MRWIVVDNTSNTVVNAVEWDGTSAWSSPSNTFVVQDTVGTYDIVVAYP